MDSITGASVFNEAASLMVGRNGKSPAPKRHGRPTRPGLDAVAFRMLGSSPLRTVALGFVLVSAGCAARPAPESAPPASEPPPPPAAVPTAAPVETGKDCASGTARCGGGSCEVKVKNDCDQAVHCALELTATCATQTGAITASGGGRGTIGAHEADAFGAQATCPDGTVTHTEITKLACK